MAVSGDELREILRDHTAAVVPSTHLAADVEARARRQRRHTTALATAGLVAVLVASVGIVVPRLGNDGRPVPPVESPTPSPSAVATVTHTATVDGMTVRTVGPTAIDGTTPFSITVTVTNPTATAWTGTVGAGLSRTAPISNAADTFIASVSSSGSGQPAASGTTGASTAEGFGILLADGSTLLDGVDDSARVTVAPGQSVDVVRRGSRYLGAAAWGPNHGWVPWLTPGGERGPIYPEPSTYPLVAVTPQESNSACATTTISSATKSGDGAWTLTHASTASATSATDRPTWTSVRGLEGSVMPVLSDVSQPDASYIAVVSGLAAYGITPPSGGGSAENPPDVTPGAAGDFISYDGVQLVTITFRGTCEPSGTALTGQLRTYDRWTGGILDCSLIPGAGSLGHEAARLCPRFSAARPS